MDDTGTPFDELPPPEQVTRLRSELLSQRLVMRRHRLQVFIAYLLITVVFVAGLFSYQMSLDRIGESERRAARENCEAINETRSDLYVIALSSGSASVIRTAEDLADPLDCLAVGR